MLIYHLTNTNCRLIFKLKFHFFFYFYKNTNLVWVKLGPNYILLWPFTVKHFQLYFCRELCGGKKTNRENFKSR